MLCLSGLELYSRWVPLKTRPVYEEFILSHCPKATHWVSQPLDLSMSIG